MQFQNIWILIGPSSVLDSLSPLLYHNQKRAQRGSHGPFSLCSLTGHSPYCVRRVPLAGPRPSASPHRASLDLFALGGNEIFFIHFTCPTICVLKKNLSLKYKQIPKFVCPPTQGEIGMGLEVPSSLVAPSANLSQCHHNMSFHQNPLGPLPRTSRFFDQLPNIFHPNRPHPFSVGCPVGGFPPPFFLRCLFIFIWHHHSLNCPPPGRDT